MSIVLDGTSGITTPALDSVARFATGDMPLGSVIQVVQGVQATTLTLNNNNTYTDTGLSATITPTSTSSLILVLVSQSRRIVGSQVYFSYSGRTRVLRGASEIAEDRIQLGAGNSNGGNNSLETTQTFFILDNPDTTSSTTYKTQIRGGFTNVASTDSANAGSTITLMEIAA